MKISVQSQDLVDEFGIDRAYRMIREAGFEAVDWNLDHAWSFKAVCASSTMKDLSVFEKSLPEIRAYYAEELEALRQNGLSIAQAHAPFGAYSYENPAVLDYAISIYQKLIAFCKEVGCPKLVIHGISKSEKTPLLTPSDVESLNMKLYESLIPTLLQNENVTVCLENLITMADSLRSIDFWEGCCSDPHQAADWIDRLNAKAGKRVFGLCLDTGHLNLLRKPFHSYVPILGDRICALHLQDNSQGYDTHVMPYAGSTHWADFLKEMKAIGYAQDLSFETFAQVRTNRLPAKLVPVFLSTIARIGQYFREELSAE